MPAVVLADDLITEVFLNIFSNSAEYSFGNEVQIDLKVDEAGILVRRHSLIQAC